MACRPEQRFNIYCDESCHLEKDGIAPMVLGAVVCPSLQRREISEAIWDLQQNHHLGKRYEAKWTKVSPSKEGFYKEIIDLFFGMPDLRFRAIVIPDKARLDHQRFYQTHDEFYYKMYFRLITNLFERGSCYRIYLDIKDTKGHEKTTKLHDILCRAHMDFDREMVEQIQQIRSHEVELMQLTDILSGALAYRFRNLNTSPTKASLIERIRDHSNLSLNRSSLLYERKFNLFVWEAQG